QVVEHPCGRGPRLARTGLGLGAVEVEVGGEECPARPLAVVVLIVEQARTETLVRDARPRRLPHLGRCADDVPLDLPAQRGVRVQEPGGEGLVHHVSTLDPAPDTRTGHSRPRACATGRGLMAEIWWFCASRPRGMLPSLPSPSGRPRGEQGASRAGVLAGEVPQRSDGGRWWR